MTKRTYMSVAVLVSATAIIIGGCAKQNSVPASRPSQVAASATVQEESVLTPEGYMPKSKVHFIEQGFHLSVEQGHYKKVENISGKIVADFGEADPMINENIINIGNPTAGANEIEPKPSGWITYADWSNDTTTSPVTYYTTSWIVPKVPKSNDGQTIFLFNGLQDGFTASSHILQPVLQWGASAAGGGAYWSITNWYVGSSAFFGALVNVSTGTSLQGVMQQTSQTGKLHSYTSSFVGYPTTDITINNAPQQWWAAETLEAYSVTKNTDYPASVNVKMTGIQILKGSNNASIAWQAVKAFKAGAQNTSIVSNSSPGGEVDIIFRK